MTSRNNAKKEKIERRSNIKGYTNGDSEFMIRSKRYPNLAVIARCSGESHHIRTEICSFRGYASYNLSIPGEVYRMLEKMKKYFYFLVYAIFFAFVLWYDKCVQSRIIVYGAAILASEVVLLHFSVPTYLWLRLTRRMQGWKKSSRALHGAQHMVFAAFDRKHDIPTLEEVKEESIFDVNCGYCNMAKGFELLLTLLIMGLFPVKYGVVPFVFMEIFAIAAMLYCKKHDLVKYLSYFAVKKPTDRELEIVLSALKLWYDIESGENEELRQKCEQRIF